MTQGATAGTRFMPRRWRLEAGDLRSPGPRRAAAACLLTAVGTLFPPCARAAATADVPWPASLAWGLLAAALGVAAGALWMRSRLARALYDARRDAEAWSRLAGALRWRTDAGHRLVDWQPSSAGSDDWRGRAPWELWQDDAGAAGKTADGAAPASLRAALEAHATLSRLPLRAGGDTGRWLCDAVPCLDADGRFCGHMGALVPAPPDLHPLRAEAQSLAALFEAMPAAAWCAEPDDAGGTPVWRVTRSNEAARRLLEAREPDTWSALLAALPDDLGAHVDALGDGAAPTSVGRWQLRMLHHGVDGRPSRALLLWPRAGSTGDEAALAEQQSISYAVSHDLRAPIRVVEGFTRILKEDYGRQLDRIANDHLDRVLAAAARMNQMIDALLGLARLERQPLARQSVNLTQLAGFVVDDLRRQYPNPPADVTIAPALMALGDPTLLRIVLENLLGNAFKYSARCPRRRIVFERTTVDGHPAFVVGDNGAGFDMSFADRLFGVFQRLHSASDFQGTGVGLASVRRIVERHGGRIWAEGEVGKGARFYFTLGD